MEETASQRSVGRFTDHALAGEVALAVMADRFCWVPGLGWLAYDGRRWAEVPDEVPREAVRAWFRTQLLDATETQAFVRALEERTMADVDRADKAVKNWLRASTGRTLDTVLKLARGLCLVAPGALDADPDLLNCRNGVVHLPTGELREHDPSLLLTQITGADYRPTALHADWTSALRAVPAAVQPWLQVRYGQACTGHAAADDRVLIQQGGGANGKSTVLAGVSAALGSYYFMASDKILMASHMGAHTTDLADLRGRRFVTIEETPEAGRLDVVRLKKLAGTELITARKMHQNNITFPATHSLVVNTNYPPVVSETDEGTWRRLLLVVFPYTFTSDPQGDGELRGDPHLRNRLHGPEQREAALAWLVEGAVNWYEAGRVMPEVPEVVAADTGEWQDRTDMVARFWDDYLVADVNAYVWAADLIWMFNQMMRQHGNAPLAENTFVRRFRTHKRTAGAMVAKARMRTTAANLEFSRPYGALDPFSRLPGAPGGQVTAWVGLRFRKDVEVDETAGQRWGVQGEQGQ